MTTPTEKKARIGGTVCIECGMSCHSGEFHPYGACLMFKACRDSDVVRSNLAAIRAVAIESQRLAIEEKDRGNDLANNNALSALQKCAELAQEIDHYRGEAEKFRVAHVALTSLKDAAEKEIEQLQARVKELEGVIKCCTGNCISAHNKLMVAANEIKG